MVIFSKNGAMRTFFQRDAHLLKMECQIQDFKYYPAYDFSIDVID